jgi:hypothetical protein
LFHKNFDLVIVSLAALLGAFLGFFGLHFAAWLSVFGIVLVLVLPGYVFSELLHPRLPFAEHLLLTLGLSVVIAGLSGLILNFTFWGLTGPTWGGGLALVTLLGAILLWLRRDGTARAKMLIWPKIAWRPALLYGLGLVFVLLAFGVAGVSSARLVSPLTMLWADYDHTNIQVLKIGVENEEGKPMVYDLVIEQNGIKVREWDSIQLEDGKTFSGQLTFQQTPQDPVIVLLYLHDVPGKVYRQVKINFSNAHPDLFLGGK